MDEFKFRALFHKASPYEYGPRPKSFGRRAARRSLKLTPQAWENEGLNFLCPYQDPTPIWWPEDWEDEDPVVEILAGNGWSLL